MFGFVEGREDVTRVMIHPNVAIFVPFQHWEAFCSRDLPWMTRLQLIGADAITRLLTGGCYGSGVREVTLLMCFT
jgi:hypothetical protein